MKTILNIAMTGLILTCLTDPDHNVYTSFQVDGDVIFVPANKLQFTDIKGTDYEVSDVGCVLMEGTLRAPGADLREEREPNHPAKLEDLPGMNSGTINLIPVSMPGAPAGGSPQ